MGQEALGISFLSPSPRQMFGLAIIQVYIKNNKDMDGDSTVRLFRGSNKNCIFFYFSINTLSMLSTRDLHTNINFNRLFQIGLRYLDQRQALVNAAVAVLPGAPDLSIFFRF